MENKTIKEYTIGFLILVILLPIIAFNASIELTLSIIGVIATATLVSTSYNHDVLEKIEKDVEEIKKQMNNQKENNQNE